MAWHGKQNTALQAALAQTSPAVTQMMMAWTTCTWG